MLLTVFLAIIFCAAVSIMLFSAVAFIQDEKFFASAPKEAQEVIKPREKELFYGARTMGWVLMVIAILMILGIGIIAVWDGFRCGYMFRQFFLRFVLIFTIYKLYDMILFDYFVLLKWGFFQYYYPECKSVLTGRKYGFNIKSQLVKLLIIFPAISALAAWLFTRIA